MACGLASRPRKRFTLFGKNVPQTPSPMALLPSVPERVGVSAGAARTRSVWMVTRLPAGRPMATEGERAKASKVSAESQLRGSPRPLWRAPLCGGVGDAESASDTSGLLDLLGSMGRLLATRLG